MGPELNISVATSSTAYFAFWVKMFRILNSNLTILTLDHASHDFMNRFIDMLTGVTLSPLAQQSKVDWKPEPQET